MIPEILKFMTNKVTIAILLILALAWLVFYWRGTTILLDKTEALEKCIAGIFSEYGLSEEKMTRSFVEEKKIALKKYIHVYKEYDVPKSFAWKGFSAALRERLTKNRFKVTQESLYFSKKIDSYIMTINYGKFDILTLRINKKKAPAISAKLKKFKNPKIVIVMDDFGNNMNYLDELFSINKPVTLSILPNLRYSKKIASLARARGYEVILHLPLEPHSKDVKEECDTIRSGMNSKDIAARLDKEVASVPGLKGVSNHMGSKATEDRELMSIIMKYLKNKNLYFFDSLTSEKSVCREVAAMVGVRCARRDMFLDNSDDVDEIEKQLFKLEEIAFRRGEAIAVCHIRKNTVAGLKNMMPQMAQDGIKFVYLSELVK